MISKRAPLLKPVPTPSSGETREALHSFVVRGCEKNGITLGDFYRHYFQQIDGMTPASLSSQNVAYLISQGSQTSRHWIEVLGVAFGVPEHILWAMTGQEVSISHGMPAPASPIRRWCTACLEDDLDRNHGPYERLLWSVNLVKLCPRHRSILQSSCPRCNRSNANVLVARILPGFCTHCSGWLGSNTVRAIDISDDHSRYMLWVARSIADLLDNKATAKDSGPRELLIAVADFHFEGNHAKLARSIHRSKSTLSTWTTGAGRMGWQTLCDASYAFHLPLKDLLEGNLDAVQTSVVRTLPFAATNRKVRKRAEEPQTERVQLYLESLLKGGHPRLLSMAAVGKYLGVHPREIRRLVPPALYQKASENLKERMAIYRKWQRDFRWQNIQLVLKSLVERLKGTEHQITRRTLYSELHAAGLWPFYDETPYLWQLFADAKRLVELEREATKPGAF